MSCKFLSFKTIYLFDSIVLKCARRIFRVEMIDRASLNPRMNFSQDHERRRRCDVIIRPGVNHLFAELRYINFKV